MTDPWDPTHHNSITLDADNRTSRVLLSATPLRDLAHPYPGHADQGSAGPDQYIMCRDTVTCGDIIGCGRSDDPMSEIKDVT